MSVYFVHRYLASDLMRARRAPRALPSSRGCPTSSSPSWPRPARRCASTRARSSSTRASPPTTGGCWSTAAVELVRRAGREESSCGDDGAARAFGPAGSARGTSEAATWRPAAPPSAGRMFRVPAQRLGDWRQRVVPVRRAPDRGLLPDGAAHGHAVPPTRGAHRARHAGRRPRPRDQQPGVGDGAGGRRVAGDVRRRCCRRSRGWRSGR